MSQDIEIRELERINVANDQSLETKEDQALLLLDDIFKSHATFTLKLQGALIAYHKTKKLYFNSKIEHHKPILKNAASMKLRSIYEQVLEEHAYAFFEENHHRYNSERLIYSNLPEMSGCFGLSNTYSSTLNTAIVSYNFHKTQWNYAEMQAATHQQTEEISLILLAQLQTIREEADKNVDFIETYHTQYNAETRILQPYFPDIQIHYLQPPPQQNKNTGSPLVRQPNPRATPAEHKKHLEENDMDSTPMRADQSIRWRWIQAGCTFFGAVGGGLAGGAGIGAAGDLIANSVGQDIAKTILITKISGAVGAVGGVTAGGYLGNKIGQRCFADSQNPIDTQVTESIAAPTLPLVGNHTDDVIKFVT